MTSYSNNTFTSEIGSYNSSDVIDYFIVIYDDSSEYNEMIKDKGGLYHQIYIKDIIALIITNVSYYPFDPLDNEIISISCQVFDESEIKFVYLHYSVDGNEWSSMLFNKIDLDIYEVTFGPLLGISNVEYFISAIDNSTEQNEGINDNYGFNFTIIITPSVNEFNRNAIIFMSIAFVFTIVANRKRKEKEK